MDATLLPALEAEDAHKIDRKSVRRPRVELITRGERRRRWSIEQKQEIVAESLGPDTTPTEVARKHAISSGLLYTWRQRLLGAQIAPPARSAPTFAQLRSLVRHRALRRPIACQWNRLGRPQRRLCPDPRG
jgi:transposase